MGRFSMKKVGKSISKNPVSNAVAKAAVVSTAAVGTFATKSIANPVTTFATKSIANPIASVATKAANDMVKGLENTIKETQNQLKLANNTINNQLSEMNFLKDEKDNISNTLNELYKKQALLSKNHADLIYKTYSPIDENQKQKFETKIAEVIEGNRVEGFEINIPINTKSWINRPSKKVMREQVYGNMVSGGSVPLNVHKDNVIDEIAISAAIINSELQNANAALHLIDATNLTGIPYKFAVTANQNQLIDNQITTNKDSYTTDMRKTEYKTYKIEWFEYINKFLFYIYYLIAFYCIFKVVLNSQPIIIKAIIVVCIFIYPFVIGRIERGIIFVYNFIKAFLLGNAIDAVETTPDSITS